jgi:putative ABC transport system permease protein
MKRNLLSQALAIISVNLRSIPARMGSTTVALAGFAGVVAVLVGLLSIAEGFRSMHEGAGADDVAIVLRAGATDELGSNFEQEPAKIASSADHVARDATGALVSAELLAIAEVPLSGSGMKANFSLRGVTPAAARLRRSFRIVSGRDRAPGTSELTVGVGTASQFPDLHVGADVVMGNTKWRIVGEHSDGGGVAESEIWGDAAVLQNFLNRGPTYQSIRVKLDSPGSMRRFIDAMGRDPRMNARVFPERKFLADQSRTLVNIATAIGTTIGLLMGLGAVVAALNAMYSAVSTRTREIATLRALGFGSATVVTSLLAEALIIGAVGGLIGALLAWFVFDGMRASTINFATYSQVAFTFAVTPALLAQGVLYALVLGLLSGLPPGLRAARMPLVEGLRGA